MICSFVCGDGGRLASSQLSFDKGSRFRLPTLGTSVFSGFSFCMAPCSAGIVGTGGIFKSTCDSGGVA